MAFTHDGTELAAVGIRSTIRVCDRVTGEELLNLAGDLVQVNELAFSLKGRSWPGRPTMVRFDCWAGP
jgi:hypothetical protein